MLLQARAFSESHKAKILCLPRVIWGPQRKASLSLSFSSFFSCCFPRVHPMSGLRWLHPDDMATQTLPYLAGLSSTLDMWELKKGYARRRWPVGDYQRTIISFPSTQVHHTHIHTHTLTLEHFWYVSRCVVSCFRMLVYRQLQGDMRAATRLQPKKVCFQILIVLYIPIHVLLSWSCPLA